LGLSVDDLAPDLVMQGIGGAASKPAVQVTMLEGRPGEALLELRLILPMSQIAQVLALVSADEGSGE
jgi:hypothetical protein